MGALQNLPEHYDFPTQKQNDGLSSFEIELFYPLEDSQHTPGDPVDLTGALVIMQLREPAMDRLVYEFSSEGEGERQLIITGNEVQFPEIKSWKLKPAVYKYELQVIDETGFVLTYLEGTWAFKRDNNR